MLQVLAVALFSLIAFGGLALIVGTLGGNRDKIMAALANNGDVADAGYVWVVRIRRSSRPAPALARSRPQMLRVAA